MILSANTPASSVPPFYQAQHMVLNTNRRLCIHAYTTRRCAWQLSHQPQPMACSQARSSIRDSIFQPLRRNAPPYTSGKASDLKHVRFRNLNQDPLSLFVKVAARKCMAGAGRSAALSASSGDIGCFMINETWLKHGPHLPRRRSTSHVTVNH